MRNQKLSYMQSSLNKSNGLMLQMMIFREGHHNKYFKIKYQGHDRQIHKYCQVAIYTGDFYHHYPPRSSLQCKVLTPPEYTMVENDLTRRVKKANKVFLRINRMKDR